MSMTKITQINIFKNLCISIYILFFVKLIQIYSFENIKTVLIHK